MSNLRTAAQQALEAMEKNTKHLPLHFDNYFEAMNVLRRALAEPVQEPLTEEEMRKLWSQHGYKSSLCMRFARAVEKAHGIGGGNE